MSHVLSLTTRIGALALALSAALSVQAQSRFGQYRTWYTVADSTLESMRGGFALDSGLLVTLGISRMLYINGALVTESSLNLGQVSQLNAAQAAQIGQQLQALSLVQNGPGNTFVPAPAVAAAAQAAATTANARAAATTAAAGATDTNANQNGTLPSTTTVVSNIPGLGPGLVIQNSLNNQSIISRTTIDASSNGLSMLRAAQMQADIAHAVQQAISSGR